MTIIRTCKAALAASAALALIGPAAPAFAAATIAGQPDISGAWGHAFPRPGQPADPRLNTGPLPAPPLKPDYMAGWNAMREKQKQADEKGEPTAGLEARCLPDGMPTLMFAIYPLEILQTPGRVTIIEEAFSQTRRIYLGEAQGKVGEVEPGYYGHSVGRWDGDTLVVDTLGIKDSVPGYRDIPHSDEEHITERIRLIDPDILEDRMTVEDPKVLEHPWSFRFVYKRLKGYHMLEYVCENNREYTDPNGGTHMQVGSP
ncbi:MAG TPA: hypothetical protein VIJ94_10910 [Caulobacteraceae bacterium]